jgi:hypothetical protein
MPQPEDESKSKAAFRRILTREPQGASALPGVTPAANDLKDLEDDELRLLRLMGLGASQGAELEASLRVIAANTANTSAINALRISTDRASRRLIWLTVLLTLYTAALLVLTAVLVIRHG